jgi:hypothetical protein
MNFERSDLLGPILDELAANDRMLFQRITPTILSSGKAWLGPFGTSIADPLSQAFAGKLSGRAKDIFQEMRRVLAGAYIDDFDELREGLKAEWTTRMDSMANIASPEFQIATQLARESGHMIVQPPQSMFTTHVEKLKPKWFAEIELFCINLHDSQAPRLFLKAGEVFAGNRAARAILGAATQSLDIIDTYFGEQVSDMLEVSSASVKIRLISNRADDPTKLAYKLFNQQFNNRVEFRLCDPKTDKLHDRFIIVDGVRALHLGGSIKDLGTSDSLIDAAELDPHKQRFEELWLKAQPVV